MATKELLLLIFIDNKYIKIVDIYKLQLFNKWHINLRSDTGGTAC